MKKSEKIFCLYLILLPIVDLITSLCERLYEPIISVGIIYKGLFIVFCIFYSIFKTDGKRQKNSIIYFITIFIFFMAYFVTKDGIFNFQFLKTEIIYAFKFFFWPLSYIGILNFTDNHLKVKEYIPKILCIIAIIYLILLIIPYLTKTAFNSYGSGFGEGIVGWFYAANEISVMMILLFPFLFRLTKLKTGLLGIISFVAAFIIALIGTKVSMLGLIIGGVLILIFSIINIKKKKSAFMYASLLLFFIFYLTFNSAALLNVKTHFNLNTELYSSSSSTISNSQEIISSVKKPVSSSDVVSSIINPVSTENKLEKFINNPKNHVLIKTIFSEREKFFLNTYNIYRNTSFDNKLVGIGFTNRKEINDDSITKLIEIDILDILFHYGVVGLIILFLPFICSIILFFKYIKQNIIDKNYLWFYLLLIFLSLGISCIAGHVLGAPPVSIYLSLFMVLISCPKKVN